MTAGEMCEADSRLQGAEKPLVKRSFGRGRKFSRKQQDVGALWMSAMLP
jgi:hypothetical protein